MMQLSWMVPAHRFTVTFNWCKRDFMPMSPKYREIRAKQSKPMDTCFWCKHAFEDGEMMALAQPDKGGNKVLCQSCAEILLVTLETEPAK